MCYQVLALSIPFGDIQFAFSNGFVCRLRDLSETQDGPAADYDNVTHTITTPLSEMT